MSGSLMVDSALTIFLSIHTVATMFHVCRKKNKVYPSEINRKIFVCGEDRSTGIHLLLEKGRKQVNRSKEPVTEDIVVETRYVSGEFVDRSFT